PAPADRPPPPPPPPPADAVASRFARAGEAPASRGSPQVAEPVAQVDVSVNGEAREVREGATLGDLLRELGPAGRRVAVGVTRSVVPRTSLESRTMAPGDRIEILEAVGGG